jgi:predicted outer membrane repeat protein
MPLKRSAMKPSTKPMARGTTRMRPRSKRNSDPRPLTGEAALCKGQPCYLRIDCCTGMAHDPCHSNQAKHGKGGAIKAHDKFTVPGCRPCHNELDQGKRFTKEEKFGIWDAAYARWEPVRDKLMENK